MPQQTESQPYVHAQEQAVSAPLAAEDQARADFYALLARLLLAPPDAALLDALAVAEPVQAQGEFALEDAWLKLTQASSVIDAAMATDEFAALFEGIGNPLLNPNASFYLTGHLNDAPLAALRQHLARLGLGRGRDVGHFEDHLGALCETMRVLVAGAPGFGRRALLEQKQFFEAQVKPWYARCLADIAAAGPANFYRVVAGVADAFLSIEAQAFAVLEPDAALAA